MFSRWSVKLRKNDFHSRLDLARLLGEAYHMRGTGESVQVEHLDRFTNYSDFLGPLVKPKFSGIVNFRQFLFTKPKGDGEVILRVREFCNKKKCAWRGIAEGTLRTHLWVGEAPPLSLDGYPPAQLRDPLVPARLDLMRKGVAALVKGRGTGPEDQEDLEECLDLMASDEHTSLPTNLPADILQQLADARQAGDVGSGDDDDDDDGDEAVDARVRMMNGYPAAIDMKVAVLVEMEDDDEGGEERTLMERITRRWAFATVTEIDLAAKDGHCVEVHWMTLTKKKTWGPHMLWEEEDKQAKPKARKRRRRKGRANIGAKKKKKAAPTKPYKAWVDACSIQCDIEFSKSLLKEKSKKILKWFLEKGEDAANFEGHDDGFEAVQNGLVAEE